MNGGWFSALQEILPELIKVRCQLEPAGINGITFALCSKGLETWISSVGGHPNHYIKYIYNELGFLVCLLLVFRIKAVFVYP